MAQENGHRIDDFFHDRLFDLEITAPADSWNKIEGSLKDKKRLFWLKFGISMAASIALFFSAGIGYYYGIHKTMKVSENTSVRKQEYQRIEAPINKFKTENVTLTKNGTNENQQPIQKTNILVAENKKIINEKNIVTPANISKNRSDSFMQPLVVKQVFLLTSNNKLPLVFAFSDRNINDYFAINEPENIETETIQPTQYNWKLGGNFAPNYSYRSVQSNTSPIATSYLNSVEKPMLAYSGGLNINYTSSRWRFESGIYYTEGGQKLDFQNGQGLYDNSKVASNYLFDSNTTGAKMVNANSNQLVTSNGIVKTTLSITNNNYFMNPTSDASNYYTQLVQKYSYLEVPFIAHYNLLNKKTVIGVEGGLSSNFLIRNSVYGNSPDQTNSNIGTTEISNVNYAGIIGLSLEVPLISRINILVEPRFRYFLNSISNESDVSTHPYSLGIFSGVSYKF